MNSISCASVTSLFYLCFLVCHAQDPETYFYKYHNSKLNAIAFSPNEKYMVTGGADGQVMLWDNTGRRLLHVYKDHKSGITGAGFMDGDRQIISTSFDGMLFVQDANSGFIRYQSTASTFYYPDAAGGIEPSLKPWVLSDDGTWLIFLDSYTEEDPEYPGYMKNKYFYKVVETGSWRTIYTFPREEKAGNFMFSPEQFGLALSSSKQWLAMTYEFNDSLGNPHLHCKLRNMEDTSQVFSLPIGDFYFDEEDHLIGTNGNQILKVHPGMKESDIVDIPEGQGYDIQIVQPGTFYLHADQDSTEKMGKYPVIRNVFGRWDETDSIEYCIPAITDRKIEKDLFYVAKSDELIHPSAIPDSFLQYGIDKRSTWFLQNTCYIMAGSIYSSPHGGLYHLETGKFMDLNINPLGYGIRTICPVPGSDSSYGNISFRFGLMDNVEIPDNFQLWSLKVNFSQKIRTWEELQYTRIRNVCNGMEDMYDYPGFSMVSGSGKYVFHKTAGGQMDVTELKTGKWYKNIIPGGKELSAGESYQPVYLSADENFLAVNVHYDSMVSFNWKTGLIIPNTYWKKNKYRVLDYESNGEPLTAGGTLDSVWKWYIIGDTIWVYGKKQLSVIPINRNQNMGFTISGKLLISPCADGAIQYYSLKKSKYMYAKYYFKHGGWFVKSGTWWDGDAVNYPPTMNAEYRRSGLEKKLRK
jgi:WD40 repeat protein